MIQEVNMKLREFVATTSKNPRYAYIADLMMDAGIPMDQDLIIDEFMSMESVVIPGKTDVTIYFAKSFLTDKYEIAVSSWSISSNRSHGKFNVMNLEAVECDLDNPPYLSKNESRLLLVNTLRQMYEIKDQSHLDQRYFEDRIEFIKNQLFEIQAEHLDEFGVMISANQTLLNKLSEISHTLFGLTRNGKQQYH
jgi:hypothetical protein